MNNIPETVIYDGVELSKKQMKDYIGLYPYRKCKRCMGRGWTENILNQDGTKTPILCRCISFDKRCLTCNIEW